MHLPKRPIYHGTGRKCYLPIIPPSRKGPTGNYGYVVRVLVVGMRPKLIPGMFEVVHDAV